MLDLLLPKTDAAVLVQAVVTVAVLGGLGWLVRSSREARVFVAGLAVLAAAFFGLRAIH